MSWLSNKKNCVVPKCSTTSKDRVGTYKFPTNEIVGALWVVALQSEELASMSYHELKSNYRVCANHFPSESIITTRNYKTRLNQDSVPCLNLPEYIVPWDRSKTGVVANINSQQIQKDLFGNGDIKRNEAIENASVQETSCSSANISAIDNTDEISQQEELAAARQRKRELEEELHRLLEAKRILDQRARERQEEHDKKLEAKRKSMKRTLRLRDMRIKRTNTRTAKIRKLIAYEEKIAKAIRNFTPAQRAYLDNIEFGEDDNLFTI